MSSRLLVVMLVLAVAAPAARAQIAQTPADGVMLYEERVRPILEANCLECHGNDPQRLRSELSLATRGGLLRGGARGPAIDVEDPGRSRLLKAIRYLDERLQMPPSGRLDDEQIDVLRQWLDLGAPYGGDEDALTEVVAGEEDAFRITDEDRAWWSVQPLVRPLPPAVQRAEWPANDIDRFVLARLESAGLEPAPPASRRHLIRRATYDLTGLSPAPEDVAAFEADDDPAAYERLVDRLLASPQYGVKWGRHWLDLLRFAETDSYERDRPKPGAWRYRDWVIDALNADMPYDEFLVHQLAGDEIDHPTAASIIATGSLRLGIWDDEPTDVALAQYDDLDSILDTTCRVMLGMSMGCARCHDHKGDPIPQEDYYRMLAYFRGIAPYKVGGGNAPTPENYVDEIPASLGDPDAAARVGPVPVITVLRVKENGPQPPATHVLIRGNPHAPASPVEPGVPRILDPDGPALPEPDPEAGTSRRRLALARWITDPENPRTARVMANRLWQHHFGRGLVRTPNDFGRFGVEPTHPELLDWLAGELIERGWSLKSMHRLIMLSSAYRMSCRGGGKALAVDPENDLLWRFDMRRLTAEEIRDSILAANGTLNLQMGGPGVYPPMPEEILATASRPGQAWGTSPPDQAARRSVYIHVKRSLLTPLLEVLDMADTDATCPVRFVTTQPTQALTLLNSDFMSEQAAHFAERVTREGGQAVEQRVRRALELALCRPATGEEVAEGVALVRELRQEEGFTPREALDAWCLLVLNLNEFVYLD